MENNSTPQHYPFVLTPLPYDYSALTPYIQTETMREHHNVLAKRYVERLNAALRTYPQYQNWSLVQLLQNTKQLPKDIQKTVHNNAGGVINHEMYFGNMTPEQTKIPGPLAAAMRRDFNTLDMFKAKFKEAALNQFGAGWAILAVLPNGRLKIVTASNQDTVYPYNVCPILLVDVWEHAYFLQYLADRGAYFDNWYKVINWNEVNRRFENCLNALPKPREGGENPA